MLTQVKNLVLHQGANTQYDIVVTENGAAKDLTGFTASGTFQKHYDSANTYTFDCTAYSNGLITVAYSGALSANLDHQKYVYDIFINETSSNTYTKVQEGNLLVKPSTTR